MEDPSFVYGTELLWIAVEYRQALLGSSLRFRFHARTFIFPSSNMIPRILSPFFGVVTDVFWDLSFQHMKFFFFFNWCKIPQDHLLSKDVKNKLNGPAFLKFFSTLLIDNTEEQCYLQTWQLCKYKTPLSTYNGFISSA